VECHFYATNPGLGDGVGFSILCVAVWVADNFQWIDGIIEWNVIFMRPIQDWEMELVLAFFAWLYSFMFRHGEIDRISWSPSRKGHFEVKLFYKKLYSPDH
jgi:hypothetical protein